MVAAPISTNQIHGAGGYGPPGGGFPPGGGGYGPPSGSGGYAPQSPAGGGYGGLPPQGFGPPGGFSAPGGPMMPGTGGEVNSTLPLVLNIVATLVGCCSGLGPVVGIVGIVFALQSGDAKKAGDFVTARARAKLSLRLAIGAFVVGVIGTPLVYYLGSRGF